MSDAGTPIDKILALLEALSARIAKIERVLLIDTKPPIEPQKPTGGLYDFVRPPDDEPRHGAGKQMATADGAELTKRAIYGVRWNGDVIDSVTYDRAWEEIEALKAGDEHLLRIYGESGIDPALAGVLLLTAFIDPAKYRGLNATDKLAEEAKKWANPQAWIQGIFDIRSGGPRPSGDE
ncbi:MAG: hypothetical protein WA014_02555 [Minisyncoccia bacterium]